MKEAITIVQIIVSVVLSGLILLQAQGTGLGATFGGGGEHFRSKRGLERVLFRLTIAVALLFLVSSLANFMVQ